jgi:hypothetical protein
MAKTGLRVHNGVLYERGYESDFWGPATDWDLKRLKDVPEARIDPKAPLLCDCGSTEFNVMSPAGEYETSMRCLKCGTEYHVHSG